MKTEQFMSLSYNIGFMAGKLEGWRLALASLVAPRKLPVKNLTPDEKLVKINGEYRIPNHDCGHITGDGCACDEYNNFSD